MFELKREQNGQNKTGDSDKLHLCPFSLRNPEAVLDDGLEARWGYNESQNRQCCDRCSCPAPGAVSRRRGTGKKAPRWTFLALTGLAQ